LRWRKIIAYYGYSDGSGEYYIVVDDEKCNGCGECVKVCPQAVLCLENLLIDLEDKCVMIVKESQRKNLKYTCAACKPELNQAPCVLSCSRKAVKCIWPEQ